MRRLRTVSLNTWKCSGAYRDRVRWMANGLKALAPNIVFLQEAFVCTGTGAEADTAGAMADALGSRAHHLSARTKPRRFEGTDRICSSNLAILTAMPLRNIRQTHLAPCPGDDDRWILSAKLDWAGLPVHLANTHFTHIGTAAGAIARVNQAGMLARLGQPPDNGLSIIGGDLNAGWYSPDLAPLRAIDDLLRPARSRVRTTLLSRSGVPTSKTAIIDHLLVRRGHKAPPVMHRSIFTALDTPVESTGAFPSDHAAMVIDLER